MTTQTLTAQRILVVDDNAETLEFIVPLLESYGHEVYSARDGEEALAQASKYAPQLILLDVVMPEQDGWLVCSKIKSLQSAPQIVLMTGSTRPDLERFADFVHADAVLHKPFGLQQIEDCLATIA